MNVFKNPTFCSKWLLTCFNVLGLGLDIGKAFFLPRQMLTWNSFLAVCCIGLPNLALPIAAATNVVVVVVDDNLDVSFIFLDYDCNGFLIVNVYNDKNFTALSYFPYSLSPPVFLSFSLSVIAINWGQFIVKNTVLLF